MTGKTHIMGGIAASTAVAYYYGFEPVTMVSRWISRCPHPRSMSYEKQNRQEIPAPFHTDQ